MYFVVKAGVFLHPLMGMYERLDVAMAFAAEALKNERDNYHSFLIYHIAPESKIENYYQVYEMHSTESSGIIVDSYVDGMIEKSSPYVFKSL